MRVKNQFIGQILTLDRGERGDSEDTVYINHRGPNRFLVISSHLLKEIYFKKYSNNSREG